MASELESDLEETVDWGRKWFFDLNAGKTQLVSFDQSNNTGAIDVKMYRSVLEGKSSFNMLGLTFSSDLDWGSYIISIAKTYLGIKTDENLNWKIHIHDLASKLNRANAVLAKLRDFVNSEILRSTYFTISHSHLNYV